MSSKLDDLYPRFRQRCAIMLEGMSRDKKLADMGVKSIIIVEGKRSLTTQIAYYCRGRMRRNEDVKAVFKAAGLWALTDSEAETPNTWTLKSKHLEGRAIDIAPSKDGKAIWWGAPGEVWERMGEIGEAHGALWGGRWKNKDCPHFEEP
jgi:hypothetical protein